MTIKNDRSIKNTDFVEHLNKSEFFAMLKSDSEMFIGIRNEYLNVYYQGASLAKIEFVKDELRYIVADKYFDTNDASSNYSKYSEIQFIEKYDCLKKGISDFQSNGNKFEKISQQKLISNNNHSDSSKWFCIDMEYIQSRVSKQYPNHGRFDIIAISKENPSRIALIELKYGHNAYSGTSSEKMKILQNEKLNILDSDVSAGSGIAGHIVNAIRYMRESRKTNFSQLKADISGIISSYKSLGLQCPIDDFDQLATINDPSFYIITVGGSVSRSQTQMAKYLHKIPGASKYCVDQLIDKNVLDNKEYIDLHFTFTEDNGSGIYDVIHDSHFTNGF